MLFRSPAFYAGQIWANGGFNAALISGEISWGAQIPPCSACAGNTPVLKFPEPGIQAIGWDARGSDAGTLITIDGSTTNGLSVRGGTDGFQGIVCDAPFTTMTFFRSPGTTGDGFQLDNFVAWVADATCQHVTPFCEIDYSLASSSSSGKSKGGKSGGGLGVPICLATTCDDGATSFESVCVDPEELSAAFATPGSNLPFTCGCCNVVAQPGSSYPSYCSGSTVCPFENVPCEFQDACRASTNKSQGKGRGKKNKSRRRLLAPAAAEAPRELRKRNSAKSSSVAVTMGVSVCVDGQTLCLNDLDRTDVAIAGTAGATCGVCG